MASGALKSKTGTHGAMRGIVYVSKAQCAKLREEIGFTEQEAARRAKITVPQLQDALHGVDWRGTGAIPLATVQAVIKRLQSSPGCSIAEAARAIGKDAAWVEDRIRDGTVRTLRTKHAPGRLYLSEPMIRRLRAAGIAPRAQTVPQAGWLRLGEAALEAGSRRPPSSNGPPPASSSVPEARTAGAMPTTPCEHGPKPTGRPAAFTGRRRPNG